MRKYTSTRGTELQPFELDGVVFHPGSVPVLHLSRLAKLADRNTDDPAALAALDEFFQAALGTDAEYEILLRVEGEAAKATGRKLWLSAKEAFGRRSEGELLAKVTPSEYDRFLAHTTARRTPPEVLMSIIEGLTEERSEVPTERSSNLPDGPPATPATYKVISSSGEVREELLTPEREAELRAAVEEAYRQNR